MITFQKKIEVLNDRVLTLNKKNVDKYEESSLSEDLGVFQQIDQDINIILNKITFFLDNDITLNFNAEKFEKALSLIKTIGKNFTESRNTESIKKGTSFRILRTLVRDLNEDLPRELESKWQSKINSIFVPSNPTNIALKMEPTETNKQILENYKVFYNDYLTFKKVPYDKKNAIEKVNQIMNELKILTKKISLVEDEELQVFIDKTTSYEGASLDMFTDKIKTWIYENNLQNKYFIKKNE